MANFKVNIYPVIYWALAYGLIAGFVLFIFFLLAKYIAILWFPVFLAGLVWGGYRNYKRQKDGWGAQTGTPTKKNSVVEEVKEAAKDIFSATRDMVAEQLEPTEGAAVTEEEIIAEEEALAEEEITEEAPVAEPAPEEEVIEEAPVTPTPEQPAASVAEPKQPETKKPETPEPPRPPV